MTLQTFFEVLMMFGFGASWPFSIMRLIKTKDSTGKSVIFLTIILIGYVAGICYKVVGVCDWVIGLYIFNLLQVSFDLFLTLKYKKNIKNIKKFKKKT